MIRWQSPRERVGALAGLVGLWCVYAIVTAFFWLIPILGSLLVLWLLLLGAGLFILTVGYWGHGLVAPLSRRLRHFGGALLLLLLVQEMGIIVHSIGFRTDWSRRAVELAPSVLLLVGIPVFVGAGIWVVLEAVRRRISSPAHGMFR